MLRKLATVSDVRNLDDLKTRMISFADRQGDTAGSDSEFQDITTWDIKAQQRFIDSNERFLGEFLEGIKIGDGDFKKKPKKPEPLTNENEHTDENASRKNRRDGKN